MSREFSGYWHAPNSSECYGGKAIHKENTLSLTLWKHDNFVSHDLLLGETLDGIKLTAILCNRRHKHHPNIETFVSETTFDVSALLIGIHIHSFIDLNEMGITFAFSGLHQWIAYGTKGDLPGQIKVPESLGRSIPFSLHDESKCEYTRFEYHKISNYVVSFWQGEKKLGSFLNYSYFTELWTRDFLSFATQQEVFTKSATINAPRIQTDPEMIKSSYKDTTSFDDGRILIQFHTIQDRIPSLWEEWCRLETEYRPLIHHHIKQLSNQQLEVSEIFLDLAVTVEFYGRKRFSLDKFEPIMNRIWEKQPESIRQLLGKKSAFSKSTRLFRNECAHLTPQKPFNRYNLDELKELQLKQIRLCWKLNVLCKTIILSELGFSHEEINRMATDPQTTNHFQIPNINTQQLI